MILGPFWGGSQQLGFESLLYGAIVHVEQRNDLRRMTAILETAEKKSEKMNSG